MHHRGRTAGYPAARTDPGVRVSRTGLFRGSRFHIKAQGEAFAPRLVRYPPQGGWQVLSRPVVSGTCFLCRLRTPVHRFPLWTAFPSAEYYQWI